MQAKKLFCKLSIYGRSILIITILVIGFSFQSCTANKQGAATPDRIVEQYLQALEQRDDRLMLRLVPEQADVARTVQAKIVKNGGHKIQERQIKYIKSKPTLWNARVRGFYVNHDGIHRNFDDSISIEYQSKGQIKLYGGRWYLLLDSPRSAKS